MTPFSARVRSPAVRVHEFTRWHERALEAPTPESALLEVLGVHFGYSLERARLVLQRLTTEGIVQPLPQGAELVYVCGAHPG